MEVYEQHGDLEQVRGILGPARTDTTQVYAQIRPAHLKQSVSFYEGKALEALTK
jgi:site-specific recombinase XerD